MSLRFGLRRCLSTSAQPQGPKHGYSSLVTQTKSYFALLNSLRRPIMEISLWIGCVSLSLELRAARRDEKELQEKVAARRRVGGRRVDELLAELRDVAGVDARDALDALGALGARGAADAAGAAPQARAGGGSGAVGAAGSEAESNGLY